MIFQRLMGFWAFAMVIHRPTQAVDTPANPSLVAQIRMAPTMLERLKILNDSDLKYDFSQNPMYSWKPGSVCNANTATWPALTDTGMTVAQLNLGPCSMLSPHIHRAMNIVISVTGSTHTYMYQENGARLVQQILTPGQITLFPAGSMHSMINEGCGNNQLYSFLNSDDSGTLNFAQAFWTFGEEIATKVMPMINIENGDWNLTGEKILPVGTGAQEWLAQCRQKCGLSEKKTTVIDLSFVKDLRD